MITRENIGILLRQAANQYPVLPQDEQRQLCFQAQKGDEQARKKLVLHNLRLVISVVRRCSFSWHKLEPNDLAQEGAIGLFTAIDRYNPLLRASFATYARHWIHHFIWRHIEDHSRTVRIPRDVQVLMRQVDKYVGELEVNRESVSSFRELAERSGGSSRINPDRVTHTTAIMEEVSFDGYVDGRLGLLVQDTVSGGLRADQQMEVDEALEVALGLTVLVSTSLVGLKLKNLKIFSRLYGLDDFSWEIRTLRSVAKEVSMTFEGVRQVRDRCWSRVRSKSGLSHYGVEPDDEWFRGVLECIRDLESTYGKRVCEL